MCTLCLNCSVRTWTHLTKEHIFGSNKSVVFLQSFIYDFLVCITQLQEHFRYSFTGAFFPQIVQSSYEYVHQSDSEVCTALTSER